MRRKDLLGEQRQRKQHTLNQTSFKFIRLCACMYWIFQNALQSPTQNTGLYCVTGEEEKDGERGKRKEPIVASQKRVKSPRSLWCSAKLNCVGQVSPATHTKRKE